MFGRKKEVKKERPARAPGSLAQYGIFEIPENINDLSQIDDDDDDEDLEAELAALTAGNAPKRPARKAPPKPAVDLDKMISDSMKDINSDEELSGDDDDPDLLSELKEITGDDDIDEPPKEVSDHTNDAVNEITKLLEERLSMYKTAEQRAKSANEASKVRRYNRGVKTLQHLLSESRAGNEIDNSEIPPPLPPSAIQDVPKPPAPPVKESPVDPEPVDTSPEVNVEEPPVEEPPAEKPPVEDPPAPVPEQAANESPQVEVDEEILNKLKSRQKEYKIAALAWKKAGNHDEAMNHIKINKMFDTVIAAVSRGETVDLSDMPPTPTLPSCTATSENPSNERKEEEESQQTTQPQPSLPNSSSPNTQSLEVALKERLEVYRRTKTMAESEGNSSKARRYGRICKQFEDALKLHARGKPVPLGELPTPPGFPELDTLFGAPKPAANPPQVVEPPKPEPSPTPEPSKPSVSRETTPVAPPRTNSDKKKKLTSRVDKQIEVLQQRQRELKLAALKAKKEGDIDLARDYLRQAKLIDPLINASFSGLPVDMKSIPLSPEAKMQLDSQSTNSRIVTDDGFTLISSMDCSEATGTDQQIYDNLEQQLIKQIKWCMTTRDHCKALGDVGNYNKWGRLALEYTKDLDMLRVKKRDNLPPPQHHYEVKTYTIVQSCTDLTDGDIEISIIRGTNYSKEVDTYVIFEFPWPTDSPSTDRTSTIRDSNNPEYNATFPLTGILDRKSRQCQRVFKRHALKCQVWSKGGFFRADSLVGTVNVKLQPLETQCVLHDSFPLMDGRKAVGGNLEVKIRLRNPITTKQIEQNTDKWLVIDY